MGITLKNRKNLGWVLFFSMTGSAFASAPAYDLRMDVVLNGKAMASPRVIAQDGVPAVVTQGDQFVEVIATEDRMGDESGVMMRFVIGTLDGDGERTVVSRPQVWVKEGESARVNQQSAPYGDQQLSLSVTAKKTGI